MLHVKSEMSKGYLAGDSFIASTNEDLSSEDTTKETETLKNYKTLFHFIWPDLNPWEVGRRE